ncbi:DUF655 domain-containing protein [Candidatus Woesearchaeota archaeon]|nr:DUF655 domain-containing protein [Candidatus Woesearchaeota archaeon]
MDQKQPAKEESAIVLDFLPHGDPFDMRPSHKKTPIVQAIGKEHFLLLELIPKKDVVLQPNEEVYIGEGKREKIHHISGRLTVDKLTETARTELEFILTSIVEKNEKQFIDFFNRAPPLTMRMHSLELIPGFGKKHSFEVLAARDEKPFESFEDMKNRVKLLPDPKKAVVKRIMKELDGTEKHSLFVG